MFPPVFTTATASSAVTTSLGSNPTRLYLFGQAVQNPDVTYAVWQLVSGSPYNCLAALPGVDRYTTQIDVYGANANSVRTAAEALRDAFEPVAYVVGWRGESRDPQTQRYRLSFDVEWHTERDPQT